MWLRRRPQGTRGCGSTCHSSSHGRGRLALTSAHREGGCPFPGLYLFGPRGYRAAVVPWAGFVHLTCAIVARAGYQGKSKPMPRACKRTLGRHGIERGDPVALDPPPLRNHTRPLVQLINNTQKRHGICGITAFFGAALCRSYWKWDDRIRGGSEGVMCLWGARPSVTRYTASHSMLSTQEENPCLCRA